MTDSSSIPINISSIYNAWTAFRRGKKTSLAIMEFEENLERNLMQLHDDLQADCYKHQLYSHRILNEKKRRDIYMWQVFAIALFTDWYMII